MSEGETVINAQNLGKAYRLYARSDHRLKQLVLGGRRTYYDEFWALRNVSLVLRRGEALGVIGENGAGKSTLLRLLCGTLRPTTGSVSIRGRMAALLELGAGFNPRFTGRENVWLNAAVLGLSKSEITQRFDAIAEFAGIGEFMDLPVKLYSSGMQARLAFAVSAHVDADILIVDEILAVGDAGFAQKCHRFLERFRARGTLLFVSHNTGMVAKLCDRALWLEKGQDREHGAADTVCMNYLTNLAERSNTAGARPSRPGHRWSLVSPPPIVRDSRRRTNNPIRISPFDPEAPWHGHGGARITDVCFLGQQHQPSDEIAGGDEVELEVRCRAERTLQRPIVGFLLRDRLGQNVFGDNTFLTYRETPPSVGAGETFLARFRFQLPYLARGDYTLTVAITEGTQEDHIHIHWIEEAVTLSVRGGPVRRGIIGVPTSRITVEMATDPAG
jgi:lipopolysaccharide transport system ATP-binding protein